MGLFGLFSKGGSDRKKVSNSGPSSVAAHQDDDVDLVDPRTVAVSEIYTSIIWLIAGWYQSVSCTNNQEIEYHPSTCWLKPASTAGLLLSYVSYLVHMCAPLVVFGSCVQIFLWGMGGCKTPHGLTPQGMVHFANSLSASSFFAYDSSPCPRRNKHARNGWIVRPNVCLYRLCSSMLGCGRTRLSSCSPTFHRYWLSSFPFLFTLTSIHLSYGPLVVHRNNLVSPHFPRTQNPPLHSSCRCPGAAVSICGRFGAPSRID